MLQETLLDIQIYLKQLNNDDILVTNDKIEEILQFFSTLKRGNILFPTKFMSSLKFDKETAYLVLNKLESMGILYTIFELYCPGCDIIYDTYYNIFDIPTEIFCEECEAYKKPYLKVKFKVMRD